MRLGTKDETGKRYGDWIVIGLSHVGRGAFWRCRCKCGAESVVRGTALRNGTTKRCASCGLKRFRFPGRHGHARAGALSPTYRTWQAMITRCHNPNAKAFKDYGARGITVCQRWRESFEAFLADMGPRPTPEHTIERKKNDVGYEPGNCIWSTRRAQNRNTRKNRRITINGETKLLADWLRQFGMSSGTFRSRVVGGMSEQEALLKPITSRR